MADVKISITAENQTGQVFKAVETGAKSAFDKVESSASGMTGKIKSAFSSLKEHWLGVTAGIAAAWLAVSKAWSLADMAAQFAEQKESLNALAGQYNTTADSIISGIQQASKGMISIADAAAIAGDAMLKHLKPDQVIALAGAAETLSNVTGDKVATSFKSMTEAIALGRSRGIEAAVGIIDLEAKYGDLTKTMSEAEKAQAMYGMVMERVAGIQATLGESTDSVSDKMEQLTVTIADLQLGLGAGLIKVGLGAAGVLYTLSAGALGAVEGFAKLMESVNQIQSSWGLTKSIREAGKESAEYWKEIAGAAGGAAEELAGKADKMFSAMAASNEDVMAASNRAKNATESAADAEKKRQEAIKKTVEELKGFSSVIKEAGQDALKFAESDFSSKMKEQEKSVEGMEAAMKEYGSTMDSVYGAQIKALEKVESAMKEAGADPATVKAQGLAILEAEKAQATARLGMWQSYYANLKTLQANAVAELLKKIEELNESKKLETDFFAALSEKFHPAETLDPYQQFWNDMEKIDQGATDAMRLEGEAKKAALKDILKSLESLPKEVVIDGEELLNQLFVENKIKERAGDILNAIKEVDQAAVDAAANQVSELGTKMLEAGSKVTELQTQITSLGAQMTALALTVDDSQTKAAISGIQDLLNSVFEKTYTIKTATAATATVSTAAPAQSGGSNYSLSGLEGISIESPTFASGTSYVPATGVYQLHQGEQVLTRSEVTNNQQSKSVTVNMGAINVSGVNKTSDEIVNEIYKPLAKKLRQLEYLK